MILVIITCLVLHYFSIHNPNNSKVKHIHLKFKSLSTGIMHISVVRDLSFFFLDGFGCWSISYQLIFAPRAKHLQESGQKPPPGSVCTWNITTITVFLSMNQLKIFFLFLLLPTEINCIDERLARGQNKVYTYEL